MSVPPTFSTVPLTRHPFGKLPSMAGRAGPLVPFLAFPLERGKERPPRSPGADSSRYSGLGMTFSFARGLLNGLNNLGQGRMLYWRQIGLLRRGSAREKRPYGYSGLSHLQKRS